MGRSYTPKYRIEVKCNVPMDWLGCWDSKQYGRVSNVNAEKYRTTFNQSFLPGGVNAHVSEARGVVPWIYHVDVVRQSDGKVMASAHAPAFEIMETVKKEENDAYAATGTTGGMFP